MVTRDDVAKRAGTSTAVVSYVVNGGPRNVSEATRRRVQEAIDELGYQPNGVARALRATHSGLFGLLVPDIVNPFFAQMAAELESSAFENGYLTFLANSMHHPERELDYLRNFGRYQVDGVLLVGVDKSSPEQIDAALANTPRVLLDRLPLGSNELAVLPDNTQGAYEATRHLLKHGFEEVGMITGPSMLTTSRDRRQGWEQALVESGVDPANQVCLEADFSLESGYRALAQMVDAGDVPRALFVQSDVQALGVLQAARQRAISVPDQLALVGFDGIAGAALTAPPLTTVRQPYRQLARSAVDALIRATHHGHSPSASSIVLDVELTIRASCGCSPNYVHEG